MAQLYYYDNIVKVVHEGKGNKANVDAIIAKARPLMLALKKVNPRMAAFHDISALTSPDDDYIRAWAALGKEMQNDSFYIAVVPNSWVRVAAKTAAFIGGFKLSFAATETDAHRVLHENGFAVTAQTPWIPR